MAIRWDDRRRVLRLSVRDLVEAGAPSGHLSFEVVQMRQSRMAEGRAIHVAWQARQAASDPRYRAEVTVKQQLVVGGWTVNIHGRVDGLTEEEGHTVVEEVKSTALDAHRLFPTTREDWPRQTSQLEVYLWMLAEATYADPVGRLVMVSIADGARHVIGVPLDEVRVGALVHQRLQQLVDARDRRLAWLATRRAAVVPLPFDTWRPGQAEIAQQLQDSIEKGRPLLVQAPTGLGKTAAAMYGVLRFALAHDKQVFWATARTTQQVLAEQTLRRFAALGLPLRTVTLTAKEKVCLNEVVACRPESCRFAEGYFDKMRDNDVVGAAVATGCNDRAALTELATRHVVCPYELQRDVSDHVDVIVGDYNYAFDPDVRMKRHFAEGDASDWIVVVDEAHQLVERARGYGSPAVAGRLARNAIARLEGAGPDYSAFVSLAREVEYRIIEAGEVAEGPFRGDEGVVELDRRSWRDLAERIDEVGLDYALLKGDHPIVPDGSADPWIDLARAVLRFVRVLDASGEETVELVRLTRDDEAISLLCLDPSAWLGPFIASLGGWVGASATLTPLDFYRDLLGLPADTSDFIDIAGFFSAANRHVIVAPRISTAFKDRRAHAERTATLIADCVAATPGNAAVYFPSFAMLRDISARWAFNGRDLLVQEPAMAEERRRAWLEQLKGGGRPVVLAAVLGGIFAEGIDLPAGALEAVLVAGPALPPVGLERDLLGAYYEERYGEGFVYASLVPGMTRVVQAAGRLLRRPEDRGVVVLIGRRFRWQQYARMLPESWNPVVADDPVAEVKGFWAATPP